MPDKAQNLKPVPTPDAEEPVSIAKPSASDPLAKFRSKRGAVMANVATLVTALPIHKISEANDYVRLHPLEETYWSSELCFVNVPVKGQRRDTLHLIDEEIAVRYLEPVRVQRFRLALATKPNDAFFLCIVPTQNTDNVWVSTNLQACELAQARWVQATSRRSEGAEGYKVGYAEDENAFPAPDWPKQSLDELIVATFVGRMIDSEDHPGLLRLRGAAQSLA